MPRRLLGMNSNMIAEHLQFIDDPCLAPIELRAQFPSVKHPFLWMSEIIDLEKQKSFFERRVTEYQRGRAQLGSTICRELRTHRLRV